MESPEKESKSGFLIKNLVRGLIWFAVIITAYILVQGELEVYEEQITRFGDRLPLMLSIFTVSEVVFGIIPPEIFMLVWQTKRILSEYVFNLAILSVISYGAGVLGYWIGQNFTKTNLFRTTFGRYLDSYGTNLKKYSGFLVLVGAVTPVPYSAMCMLAGSANFRFKYFLLISIARILRFSVYGWMVWSFPNYFNG
ncbi:MAG: hypothetical protein AB7K37_00840 [Cyclobacteriaceae bacterium]